MADSQPEALTVYVVIASLAFTPLTTSWQTMRERELL